jgi:MFS family permease
MSSGSSSSVRNVISIIGKIGSALCGAAQSMNWLIVSRAVQGFGAGGIVQLVQTTISDIVSLQR